MRDDDVSVSSMFPSDASIRYFFVVDVVPVGEAPDDVRQQWVGLALPVRYPRWVEGPQPVVGRSVVTGTRVDINDAVTVRMTDCLAALTRAGRSAAAEYWQAQAARRAMPALAFRYGEGRLLPADLARRLIPGLDDVF